MFVENCRAFGMTINMPAHYAFIHSTPEDVEKTIAIAKQEKCEFVMFITADGITSLHSNNLNFAIFYVFIIGLKHEN